MPKHVGVREVDVPVADYDETEAETYHRLEDFSYSNRQNYYEFAMARFKRFRDGSPVKYRAFKGQDDAKTAKWRWLRINFPPEKYADGTAAGSQLSESTGTTPPPSDESREAPDRIPPTELPPLRADQPTVEPEPELEPVVEQLETDSIDVVVAEGDVVIDRAMVLRLARNGEWVANNLHKYKSGRRNFTYPAPMCGVLLQWADEDLPDFMNKFVLSVGKVLTALEEKQAERERREAERQEKIREREEAKLQAKRDDDRDVHSVLAEMIAKHAV